MIAYLLDADVLIGAKNRHYGFDFCPAFWDWLVEENWAGRLYSIQRVYDEVKDGKDELAAWAKAQATEFFLAADVAVTDSLAKVSKWAVGQQYRQSAVNEFLSGADYYLVAHALAHDHTVITHETKAPNSVTRIKIPDACAYFGIETLTPFAMLRQEKARFVLPP